MPRRAMVNIKITRDRYDKLIELGLATMIDEELERLYARDMLRRVAKKPAVLVKRARRRRRKKIAA